MPVYQGWADRLLARLAHRAIAVSGSTREFLIRERHVPEARVRLIWNGVPLDEFAPLPAAAGAAVRAELGMPQDSLLVGSIGRLSEQKGHRYLLEAARIVLERNPRVRFLVVGDGDLAAPLREQATRLGISGAVTFAGHRADVPAVLAAVDLLCISSTYEGTPLTLFEAMASAKAIVSTAVDGCREVVDDGETGLLVPPRDPAALAQALDRVLGDRSLRERLAMGACQASRRYDIGETVREMERVYDEVLREL
jgi:glycosyltransferase involved in cell wall biosynthesis